MKLVRYCMPGGDLYRLPGHRGLYRLLGPNIPMRYEGRDRWQEDLHPRIPQGNSRGGEWTDGSAAAASNLVFHGGNWYEESSHVAANPDWSNKSNITDEEYSNIAFDPERWEGQDESWSDYIPESEMGDGSKHDRRANAWRFFDSIRSGAIQVSHDSLDDTGDIVIAMTQDGPKVVAGGGSVEAAFREFQDMPVRGGRRSRASIPVRMDDAAAKHLGMGVQETGYGMNKQIEGGAQIPEGDPWGGHLDPVKAAQQGLSQVPKGAAAHAIEILQQTRDFRKTGTIRTKEFDTGYAANLYDALKAMGDRGDGQGGDVYDLSAELGPRAIGYHSPAGVLALVPPMIRGQSWEVRYSGQGGATPQGPQPGGGLKRPARVSRQLKEIVAEGAGPDPKNQAVLLHAITQVHELQSQEVEAHNTAYRAILDQFMGSGDVKTRHGGSRRSSSKKMGDDERRNRASGAARGAFLRSLRAAQDPDAVPMFDEIRDYALQHFPHVASGREGSEEANVFEFLKTGLREAPAIESDEVVGSAFEFLDAQGFGREPEDETETEPEMEYEEFRMPREWWRERYQLWRLRSPERYTCLGVTRDGDRRLERC